MDNEVSFMRMHLRGFASIALPLLACSFSLQAAQVCYPQNIRAVAPTPRYTINANGTVLDRRTGLLWKRCVEGLSGADCTTGAATSLNWGDALSLAAGSTFAGYKDWRLPNTKELESLVEVQCYFPSVNLAVFPNTPVDGVWTSSPYAIDSNNAWYIDFNVGSTHYDSRYFSVYGARLVRGGQ
jgi:hypothetical protein